MGTYQFLREPKHYRFLGMGNRELLNYFRVDFFENTISSQLNFCPSSY